MESWERKCLPQTARGGCETTQQSEGTQTMVKSGIKPILVAFIDQCVCEDPHPGYGTSKDQAMTLLTPFSNYLSDLSEMHWWRGWFVSLLGRSAHSSLCWSTSLYYYLHVFFVCVIFSRNNIVILRADYFVTNTLLTLFPVLNSWWCLSIIYLFHSSDKLS